MSIPRANSFDQASVNPTALASFLRDIIMRGLNMHSITVVRNGMVAYEDYRAPYTANDPHILYSVSKSITALAVGFAVEEGLLSVNSKAADLLPELRVHDKHAYVEQLRVQHLLTCTAGKKLSAVLDRSRQEWVIDYAQAEWIYAPGEGFHYCNENTYLLCLIITRLAGMSVTDYLMPRLFAPLGITRPYWETDRRGVETGGWGLSLRTEDLAKIAMCCADEGRYLGKQVLPVAWVKAACGVQVDNTDRDSQDYGYCFWQNTHPGSCRMDGMFGQFAWIFPEYNAVVVATGGELNMGEINQALMRHIPSLFDGRGAHCASEFSHGRPMAAPTMPRLPAYPPLAKTPRNAELEAQLNSQCIRFPDSVQKISRVLRFSPGMMPAMVFFMSHDKAGGIDKVHLRFGENTLRFSWNEGRERNAILCGMDGQARKCAVILGGVRFVLSSSACWRGDELHLRLRCVNAVAERSLVFTFAQRGVVTMLPRSNPPLSALIDGAAEGAKDNIANPLLANVVSRAMAQVVSLAEPLHVGVRK
ncbi:MAG: beta-lactamase family protein [Oscillospiraceae bacterium]|nr:beta-lactamase family protein [Oscillospiraceae bacterium]